MWLEPHAPGPTDRASAHADPWGTGNYSQNTHSPGPTAASRAAHTPAPQSARLLAARPPAWPPADQLPPRALAADTATLLSGEQPRCHHTHCSVAALPHAARKWVPVARANHTGSSGRTLCPSSQSPYASGAFQGLSRPVGQPAVHRGTPSHGSGPPGGDGWVERRLGGYVGSGPSSEPSQLASLRAHILAKALGAAGGGRWAGHRCRTILPSSSQHGPA